MTKAKIEQTIHYNKMQQKFLVIITTISIIAALSSTFVVMQGSHTSGIQSDNMKGLGHVTLVLYGADGSIKAYRQTDNLIVSNGDNSTVNKMFGVARTTTGTVGTFNAVQVGTTNTAPTTADTKLACDPNCAGHKVIGTTSITTATRGNVVLTATFNPGKITNSSASIVEAGIFDNTAANLGSNSTNMFARQTFTSITVGSADTLTITWTVNIT